MNKAEVLVLALENEISLAKERAQEILDYVIKSELILKELQEEMEFAGSFDSAVEAAEEGSPKFWEALEESDTDWAFLSEYFRGKADTSRVRVRRNPERDGPGPVRPIDIFQMHYLKYILNWKTGDIVNWARDPDDGCQQPNTWCESAIGLYSKKDGGVCYEEVGLRFNSWCRAAGHPDKQRKYFWRDGEVIDITKKQK